MTLNPQGNSLMKRTSKSRSEELELHQERLQLEGNILRKETSRLDH